MTRGQRRKALGVTVACTGVAIAGMLLNSARRKAEDRGDDSDSRIEQGFEIAPVHLNLEERTGRWWDWEGDLSGWRTRFRRVSTAARYWLRAHHLSQFNTDSQNWFA